MDCPIIPLVSLTVSCCVFGIAYFDASPYSTGALLSCLAFSIATAFAYWLYASQNCCANMSGHLKTPGNHKSSNWRIPTWSEVKQSLKPDMAPLQNFWTSLKKALKPKKPSWFKNLQNKINPKDREGGVVVFRRTPKAEVLFLLNPEWPLSLAKPDPHTALYPAALKIVSDETGISPSEFSQVDDFSVPLKKRGPDGRTNPLTYYLAEVPSKVEVNDGEWLTFDEAYDQCPTSEMASALKSCYNKIKGMDDESPKRTGVPSAELDKWYRDPESDAIWRVIARSRRTISAKLNDQPTEDQSTEDQPTEETASPDLPCPGCENAKDCSKEIWISMVVSILLTVSLMTALALVVKFFPEQLSQLRGFIVDNLTRFKEAANGYLENVGEDLKAGTDKVVDNVKDWWNPMSNFFSKK